MTNPLNAKKDPSKRPETYVNVPLDTNKEIRGNSRAPSDAPPEIQQKCIDIIIEEARNRKMSVRDIAYYIAIAHRESGFNPDAANDRSTASGIAQVQAGTGENYGINDRNRFDARASIRAGLDFFLDIKKRLNRDYGRTDGDYEPLIYFLYHYGEFYHYRDRHRGRNPYSLSELLEKYRAKYDDSATVVHQAIAFEKILNDSHALQIQLRDVTGKPMPARKVLVLVPKQEKTTKSKTTAVPPVEASPSRVSTTSDKALTELQTTENPRSTPHSGENAALSENTLIAEVGNIDVEAKVYTTDAEGNIPEIETTSEQPLLVLVPRPNYEEYAEAVIKGEIIEENQPHELLPRGDIVAGDVLPTTLEELPGPVEKRPIEIESTSSVSTQSPVVSTPSVSETSTQSPKNSPPVNALPPKQNSTPATAEKIAASASQTVLNWNDVKKACDSIGWECVRSGFVYAKQFVTKPKLPETPFAEGKPKPGNARVQSIASSLKASQVRSFSKKDALVTKEQTQVKEYRADEGAPWMDIALAEQRLGVQEMRKDHLDDPNWRKLNAERQAAERQRREARRKLTLEYKKPNATKNENIIQSLNSEITDLSKRIEEIETKQAEIEAKTTNPEIAKYLRSAGVQFRSGVKGADSSSDETAWCASFVTWVLKKSGIDLPSGTAKASWWMNWGEALSEPRYGAVVVVGALRRRADGTADTPSGSHVGFFVGQRQVKSKKRKSDGSFEETTITYTKILGGNQSIKGQEIDGITESEFPSTTWGIAAIRWPKK